MKIQVEKASYFYSESEDQIISNCNLTIDDGEIVAIQGPSGCGKSTLLELIIGLLQPTSGSIEYYNYDEDKEKFSSMLRESELFPWKTIIDNLTLISDDQRSLSYLEELELLEYAKYYPNSLSAGMEQRVILARAVLQDSQALILDEPFNGLDERIRKISQNFLLKHRGDRSILFVTHNPDEVIGFADRILIWDKESLCPKEITMASYIEKVRERRAI